MRVVIEKINYDVKTASSSSTKSVKSQTFNKNASDLLTGYSNNTHWNSGIVFLTKKYKWRITAKSRKQNGRWSNYSHSLYSGSHEQFLHCGLRKYHHSKSSVYRWYTQLNRHRFVNDTCKTMKATWTHHGWMHMFITHQPTLTLQLHNFDLFRTCRTTNFCTVAWQLARFQLTRRIARSLGNSWASCLV